MQLISGMKRILLSILLALCVLPAFAQDDYYRRKAESYTREAEYYRKKADGYRREAEYYMKKAADYDREASYYLRKGDTDRAKMQQRYATDASDGLRPSSATPRTPRTRRLCI